MSLLCLQLTYQMGFKIPLSLRSCQVVGFVWLRRRQNPLKSRLAFPLNSGLLSVQLQKLPGNPDWPPPLKCQSVNSPETCKSRPLACSFNVAFPKKQIGSGIEFVKCAQIFCCCYCWSGRSYINLCQNRLHSYF